MFRRTEKYWYELHVVNKGLDKRQNWLMYRATFWFLFIPIYSTTQIVSKE